MSMWLQCGTFVSNTLAMHASEAEKLYFVYNVYITAFFVDINQTLVYLKRRRKMRGKSSLRNISYEGQ